MALISDAFDQLLKLLPTGIHAKTEHIYSLVPGTLMKFLDTNTVQKKIHCHGKITVDGKLHLFDEDEGDSYSPLGFTDSHHTTKEYDQPIEGPVVRNDSKVLSRQLSNPPRGLISSASHFMPNPKDSHIWRTFLEHFCCELGREFDAQSVTEIHPNDIGDIIFERCQQQCLNPDKQDKRSSSPVRFEKCYPIAYHAGRLKVIFCYVNAYMVCQTTKTWTQKSQTEMTYDVTIELKILSQDHEKAKQFENMLVNNDITDVIRMLEDKSKLTWEGFLKKN